MTDITKLAQLRGRTVDYPYYLVECDCGKIYPSSELSGGEPMGESGDYSDCYCPHCGEGEEHFAECADPETAWKAQQDKIDALVEALEKAQSAGSINNQWKPDVCPITGRRFFMWIEHPELGYVPTYGGPYDSYTIPTRDSDGEFSCERYDHDVGGWVDGECVGAYLIDDDEQSRVYELEQRIAELESRTVKLPDDEDGQAYGFGKWANGKLPATAGTMTIAYCEDAWRAAFEVFSSTAGIKVEAE
ncbi:hypothetical protein ACXH7K_001757 [Klebsiella variicola]